MILLNQEEAKSH